MRIPILALAAGLAAVVATPILAQARGGGVTRGPLRPSPGPRDGGWDVSDIPRDLGARRGQSGRDLADRQRSMTPEERRLRTAELRAEAERQRAYAFALAEAARRGQPFPDGVRARIRRALELDIDAWREEFGVSRSEWQAMRDEWLAGRSALTAEEWALRRAAWFEARDAWIARHRPSRQQPTAVAV